METFNHDPLPELEASMKAHAAGDEHEAQVRWELYVRHLFARMAKAGAKIEWTKR